MFVLVLFEFVFLQPCTDSDVFYGNNCIRMDRPVCDAWRNRLTDGWQLLLYANKDEKVVSAVLGRAGNNKRAFGIFWVIE